MAVAIAQYVGGIPYRVLLQLPPQVVVPLLLCLHAGGTGGCASLRGGNKWHPHRRCHIAEPQRLRAPSTVATGAGKSSKGFGSLDFPRAGSKVTYMMPGARWLAGHIAEHVERTLQHGRLLLLARQQRRGQLGED